MLEVKNYRNLAYMIEEIIIEEEAKAEIIWGQENSRDEAYEEREPLLDKIDYNGKRYWLLVADLSGRDSAHAFGEDLNIAIADHQFSLNYRRSVLLKEIIYMDLVSRGMDEDEAEEIGSDYEDRYLIAVGEGDGIGENLN